MNDVDDKVNELMVNVATNKMRAEHIGSELQELKDDSKESFNEIKQDVKELRQEVATLDKKNDEQHAAGVLTNVKNHSDVMAKIDVLIAQYENTFSNKALKFVEKYPKLTIIAVVIGLGAFGVVQIGELDLNTLIPSLMGND